MRAALEALQSSGPVAASAPRRRQLLVLPLALALTLLILAALAWRFRTAVRPEIHAVAVLPFVNVGGAPDTEYLSDGITESILNSLSQLRQLRVVPRSTVFRYKGREIDPQAVGRELRVQAVVMGRVLQRGDVLSVQAELVDVAGRSQLWGERYDRRVSDILRIEQDTARHISENLRLTLTGEDRSRVAAKATGDPEAYRLYLNGRYHWNKRNREGFQRGIEYFNQAIEKDPSYALAYAGLAYSYNAMGHQLYSIMDPRESYPKAETAAMKALQLDKTLAEAHTVLGDAKLRHDWDWTGAEKEHRRAIELNPAYSTARQLYSHYLLPAGRVEESLFESRQALLLEPLSLAINLHLGWHYLYSQQLDQAVAQLQKTLDIDPTFALGLCFLGQAYEQKGMYREAIAAFEKAVSLSKDNPNMFAALVS